MLKNKWIKHLFWFGSWDLLRWLFEYWKHMVSDCGIFINKKHCDCSSILPRSQRPSWTGTNRYPGNKALVRLSFIIEGCYIGRAISNLGKALRDAQDRAMTKGTVVIWICRAFLLQRRGHICYYRLQVLIKTERDYTAAPCWWAVVEIFFPPQILH